MLAGGFYERTSGAAGQALGHRPPPLPDLSHPTQARPGEPPFVRPCRRSSSTATGPCASDRSIAPRRASTWMFGKLSDEQIPALVGYMARVDKRFGRDHVRRLVEVGARRSSQQREGRIREGPRRRRARLRSDASVLTPSPRRAPADSHRVEMKRSIVPSRSLANTNMRPSADIHGSCSLACVSKSVIRCGIDHAPSEAGLVAV